MDLNEILGSVQALVESKSATNADIESIKTAIAEYETKTSSFADKSEVTSVSEEVQTQAQEIKSLKEQLETIEIAFTKGQSMSSQTPEIKTADIKNSIKAAILEGRVGEIKAVVTTADAGYAPLFQKGWEAEILKRLMDYSPILSHVGITKVDTAKNSDKRIQVSVAGARVGVENTANASIAHTSIAAYDWLRATFSKIEAMPIITAEAIQDGDFNLADIEEDLQISFGVLQAAWALNGNGSTLTGVLARCSSALADATRPFTAYQTATPDPLKFCVVNKDTIAQLQATKRSLATPYRKNAKWFMNEETFDVLSGMTDANGSPLIKDLLVEGAEGRLMGYPVVIDPTLVSFNVSGVSILFGDVAQAFKVFNVGDMTVRVDQPANLGGNVQFYHSLRVGERMNDCNALKAIKKA
ncbi:phage major capsid protein [Aeromonas sobria]|uniref:phage major capsid protein n=1 Tax=Aeromonas sobria TaxID=646 RepID=UPI000C6EA682|nr:phage major capsid protein [Aeromonas sobria]PKQ78084.1 phage major capsid protein [Aeromonas sobria]